MVGFFTCKAGVNPKNGSDSHPLEFPAVFGGHQPGLFEKYLAKRAAVFVAHLVGDFVKRAVAALQQALGRLDANALLVGQRGFAGVGFEAPLQGAAAHAALARELVVAEALVEILLDPRLHRLDLFVAVIFAMLEDGVGRLGGSADVADERFG